MIAAILQSRNFANASINSREFNLTVTEEKSFLMQASFTAASPHQHAFPLSLPFLAKDCA